MSTGQANPRAGAHAVSGPPPRFPKRGYDVLVDHDHGRFRYYVPDPKSGPGFFLEIPAKEAVARMERRLALPDPTGALALFGLAVVLSLRALDLHGPSLILGGLAALAMVPLALHYARARRVRIWYNVERPEIDRRLRLIRKIAADLSSCQKVWMVLAEIPGTAGKTCWVEPVGSGRLAATPPATRLRSWKASFYLLPGGILARREGHVFFGPYEAWNSRWGSVEVPLGGRVPSDSPQRGKRPKYTTRGGVPDPRFRHNPTVTVVELGELVCGSGRAEMHLRTSNPETAAWVAADLRALAAGTSESAGGPSGTAGGRPTGPQS